MQVPITLRKLLSNEFKKTFRRAKEFWPEALDVHTLIKIDRAIELEYSYYQSLLDLLFFKTGIELDSEDIINTRILTKALKKVARLMATDEKNIDYKDELRVLLDQEFFLEIPRLIVVTPGHIKKGLSLAECAILAPFLDMTQIQ